MAHQLEVAADDQALIVAFAGCSLDEKPGSNWVQDQGGLPEYICQVARAIKRSGKSTSQAIAIAVSRIKKWATGAGVDADTQAKATKALAQWEKKKAAAKADNKVKASHVDDLTMSDRDLLFLIEWTHPCTESVTPRALQQIMQLSTPVLGNPNRLITPGG